MWDIVLIQSTDTDWTSHGLFLEMMNVGEPLQDERADARSHFAYVHLSSKIYNQAWSWLRQISSIHRNLYRRGYMFQLYISILVNIHPNHQSPQKKIRNGDQLITVSVKWLLHKKRIYKQRKENLSTKLSQKEQHTTRLTLSVLKECVKRIFKPSGRLFQTRFTDLYPWRGLGVKPRVVRVQETKRVASAVALIYTAYQCWEIIRNSLSRKREQYRLWLKTRLPPIIVSAWAITSSHNSRGWARGTIRSPNADSIHTPGKGPGCNAQKQFGWRRSPHHCHSRSPPWTVIREITIFTNRHKIHRIGIRRLDILPASKLILFTFADFVYFRLVAMISCEKILGWHFAQEGGD